MKHRHRSVDEGFSRVVGARYVSMNDSSLLQDFLLCEHIFS